MFLSADDPSSKPKHGCLKIDARFFDLYLSVWGLCLAVKIVAEVSMVY